MTPTNTATPQITFTDAEARLIAQILNAQAVNQRVGERSRLEGHQRSRRSLTSSRWQCNSPQLTALLGSLRGRKILEKVPGRTPSSKVSWRVTTHGLHHPALQESGNVHTHLSAHAKLRFAAKPTEPHRP